MEAREENVSNGIMATDGTGPGSKTEEKILEYMQTHSGDRHLTFNRLWRELSESATDIHMALKRLCDKGLVTERVNEFPAECTFHLNEQRVHRGSFTMLEKDSKENDEAARAMSAFRCKVPGCNFVSATARGMAIHNGFMHSTSRTDAILKAAVRKNICPQCGRKTPTERGLAIHIGQVHKGDPVSPKLESAQQPEVVSPNLTTDVIHKQDASQPEMLYKDSAPVDIALAEDALAKFSATIDLLHHIKECEKCDLKYALLVLLEDSVHQFMSAGLEPNNDPTTQRMSKK